MILQKNRGKQTYGRTCYGYAVRGQGATHSMPFRLVMALLSGTLPKMLAIGVDYLYAFLKKRMRGFNLFGLEKEVENMFFRRKKEEDPELEAEYRRVLEEFQCEMDLKGVMQEHELEWRDVLNIVKDSLK